MQRDNGRRSFFRLLAGLLGVAASPAVPAVARDVWLYGSVHFTPLWASKFPPNQHVRIWRHGKVIFSGPAEAVPLAASCFAGDSPSGFRAALEPSE